MCSVTTGGLSRNMSTSYEMLRFFGFFNVLDHFWVLFHGCIYIIICPLFIINWESLITRRSGVERCIWHLRFHWYLPPCCLGTAGHIKLPWAGNIE